MARFGLLATVAGVGGDALSIFIGIHKTSLTSSSEMQPDEAAGLLISAEKGWQSDADTCSIASDAQPSCQSAPEKFTSSCRQVVSTLLQGSGGNQKMMFRRRLQQQRMEFFESICGQDLFEGSHKKHCDSLAGAVSSLVTDHVSDSEVHEQVETVCMKMWSDVVRDAAVAQAKNEVQKVAEVREEAEAKIGAATSKVQEVDQAKAEVEAKLESQLAQTTERLEAEAKAKEEVEKKLNAKKEMISEFTRKLNATKAQLEAANHKLDEMYRSKAVEEQKEKGEAEEADKLEAKLKDSQAKLQLVTAKAQQEAEAEAKAEDEVKSTENARLNGEKEFKAKKEDFEKVRAAEEAKLEAEEAVLKSEEAKLQAEETARVKAKSESDVQAEAHSKTQTKSAAKSLALASQRFRRGETYGDMTNATRSLVVSPKVVGVAHDRRAKKVKSMGWGAKHLALSASAKAKIVEEKSNEA